jgi:colanic acid/amylovoran biosynthesis glycosyltransferase
MGWLADERDVDGLVHHIRWMVAHPERWQDMAIAGRRHVEQEFDARTQGQRLAEIYRELIV